ncbi:hypothetical protein [Neobacillus sp. YIM B06451]|uniref:hypothetical protein n=1 Tax=Neobacillus sp. YIM B06451 TaxID=3070994 RepID=UPI00292F8DFD|nr:hypothetical protein [Neobacillus sp. YIM B06451]
MGKKKKKNKMEKKTRYNDYWGLDYDSDETFAFIAGYTSGGAPYGITHKEMAEIEREEREAKQRKKALTDPSLAWVDDYLRRRDPEGNYFFGEESYNHYEDYYNLDEDYYYLHEELEYELQIEREQLMLQESAERLSIPDTLSDDDAPYLLEDDASFFIVKCIAKPVE